MEDFVFSVDSALLSELGEKLVETVHVALSELVKNSYDADATEVTVKFKSTSTGGPEIQIIDNGLGMTYDGVCKYWMRIATRHKEKEERSFLYGRPRTGSKGIGRFSCRRLGRHLKLITTAKMENGKYERTEVTFQWGNFKIGTDVNEIHCPGKKEIVDNGPTGTTLIVSENPIDEWKERGYNYLKRQLAVLVSNRGTRRKGYEEDPGFNIILDVPKFEDGIKDLREELISAGWGTLCAS